MQFGPLRLPGSLPGHGASCAHKMIEHYFLLVLPTLTRYPGIGVVSDIPSGGIDCIYSDTLSGIPFDILCDGLSRIYLNKLVGIYFDIFSGI